MEPWKRTILTIVLLLLGLTSTSVHADITETPSSGVFLEGSDVTLTCVVEGNNYVIWEDFREATEIFVGKEKNTEKKKYDNFEISSGDEDFSLIIKDVQLSDEGTYICKDRDQHPNATVTIGVLPNVYISVKQSEDTQAPQKSTEVNITCSAYNARPAVSVFELSVIGSGKTVNITNDKSIQNEDGKTYNSSASVSYIMSLKDMSVSCRVFTAGRSLSHTENFYKPRCNIIISGNEIRCLCQANPPVNTYYMDINGNKRDGDVLFIEEVEPMNIRCFATNELGTGQSDRLFPDDMHSFGLVPVAVIVSVVVLLVVITVIYIRCRRGPRKKKSDEEQPKVPGAIEEQSGNLLPQSENKPDKKEQQEDTKERQPKVPGANEGESVNLLLQSENKPDEKEQQEDSKVSPDENEEDTKRCGREQTPPDNINDVEEDLWNYITNDLCPQISLDWEIFAVEVLKLEKLNVVDIIEHTKDEEGQILSMFRKWRYMKCRQSKVSKQSLRKLIKDNELSDKIMSKDNILNDVTALKVKHANEDDCSEEFLKMLTNFSKRIGVVGRERFAEMNSNGGLFWALDFMGLWNNSSEASEGILVDDSVNSLGQLCLMLGKANLFTARDVVIVYIEKKLQNVIEKLSKERASTWDEFKEYGLSLSDEDVVYIERAAKSNEERVCMAISKWIRKKNIDKDDQEPLKEEDFENFPELGTDVLANVFQGAADMPDDLGPI